MHERRNGTCVDHRQSTIRAVTVLTRTLQDGCDVLREGDLPRRLSSLLSGWRQHAKRHQRCRHNQARSFDPYRCPAPVSHCHTLLTFRVNRCKFLFLFDVTARREVPHTPYAASVSSHRLRARLIASTSARPPPALAARPGSLASRNSPRGTHTRTHHPRASQLAACRPR